MVSSKPAADHERRPGNEKDGTCCGLPILPPESRFPFSAALSPCGSYFHPLFAQPTRLKLHLIRMQHRTEGGKDLFLKGLDFDKSLLLISI
jgi:hypothetical protein